MNEDMANVKEEDIPSKIFEDEEEDLDYLVVLLSKEKYLAMYKPWRKALIIKVLGCKVGYAVIRSKIFQM